jgi:hypothetical protein
VTEAVLASAARLWLSPSAGMNDILCARCSRPVEGHAVQGPGGWMHAACAPKSTPPWVVPLAIVGCAVPVAFAVLVGVFLAIWQFLSPTMPPATATAADAGVTGTTEALTQRYEMGNKMLAVHYPASFAASRQGDAAVIVTRALPDGNAETLVFEAVAEPISTDIQEINRVLEAAEAKLLDGYVVLSRRPATCNGRPGLEVIGSFPVTATGATYDRRACRFYEGKHFYTFAYALPREKAAAETRLLETIVEATELLP